ncbi:MAG: hypothetical protein NTX56_09715, partial [Proteobacteria bacterium]|nr:hypothetical protein [Pseudomonadota bacterium]
SDAVQGRDREAVRALAHALISITGNLSATELAALARRTELSVTEASDDYMELAARLAVQTGELMALLRARLS